MSVKDLKAAVEFIESAPEEWVLSVLDEYAKELPEEPDGPLRASDTKE